MNERRFVIETPEQRDRLTQFIAKHPVPFQCEVGPVREQRSVSANSRLWSLHQMASKHTGHSPDEMHEFALARYFGSEEKTCGGIRRLIPIKRSSTREKKEFSEFMEATETWYATDFGCWLDQERAA